MDEITKTVLCFFEATENDPNHRYKSWEHCYSYFQREDAEVEICCLHLAFYLASWGMYRGSSFLLWKDYLVHKEVVLHLLKHKVFQTMDFGDVTQGELEEIFGLITWVKAWYQENVNTVNGQKTKINVTDTLATKIILGALGCVPAYDRYFIAGLRSKGFRFSELRLRHLLDMANFYRKNRPGFDSAQEAIHQRSGIYYPPMKLVDMYFWTLGVKTESRGSEGYVNRAS